MTLTRHLSRRRLGKFTRFAAVGLTNGLIYAVATAVYISLLGIGDKLASLLGFVTAIPYAFFAHRAFTFSSDGSLTQELWRFTLTQATSMLISVAAMAAAVDYLGAHYIVGIIGAVTLVPIANFIVLDNWVFKAQSKAGVERQ